MLILRTFQKVGFWWVVNFLYLLSKCKNLLNSFKSAHIKHIEAVTMIKSCDYITAFVLHLIILLYIQVLQVQNLCSALLIVS